MSLVKFDPVNHVFILEVLSSLRDSFCDSRASWSSSSWWIFCSSQSPVLAPPPQLAPKIVGETPSSILSLLLSLHEDLPLPVYTLRQRPYLVLWLNLPPVCIWCPHPQFQSRFHSWSPESFIQHPSGYSHSYFVQLLRIQPVQNWARIFHHKPNLFVVLYSLPW